MASSVAEELANIYNDVITNNLSYCSICLRTEQERKLVDPQALMSCLVLLRLRVSEHPSICFLCESQVRRALGLLQMLEFAGSVNRWFRAFAAGARQKEGLPEHLDRLMASKSLKCGASFQEMWTAVRASTTLSQTEILQVNSDCHAVEPDKEPPPRPSTHPPPPEQPTHRDQEMDNIVIIDDEDDPKSPLSPPTNTQSFILHVNNSYLPPINTTVKNGNFEFSPMHLQQDTASQTPTVKDYASERSGVEVGLYMSNGDGSKRVEDSVDKQPVRTGRIDWEDKIPMDVISFMDAIDPNADQILTPQPPSQHTLEPLLFSPPPVNELPTDRRKKSKKRGRSQVVEECEVVIDLC